MFKYGMLYRGFSPACQPMNGLIERQDDTSGKYFDVLVYDRRLTDEEIKNYELEEITMAKKINLIELTAETGLIKNGAKQPKDYAAFCMNQPDVDPAVIKTMDDTPEKRCKMTVYIVTEGIYSDYRIEKVFSTREQAEMYCAAHEEDSYSVYHIEEYVVDDVILESASEVHYLYYKYTGGPSINNKFELKYTLRPVRDWEKTQPNNSYYPGYKYSIITDHKTGQKELEEMLKKWEKFIKDEV